MGGKNSGNFGDTDEHKKAGSMSSGNKDAAENLSTEDRSKGGQSQGADVSENSTGIPQSEDDTTIDGGQI